MAQLSLSALTELRQLYTLRGLAGIMVGAILIIWPKLGVSTLLFLFWLILFIDGGIQSSVAFSLRRQGVVFWFLPLILGIAEISAAIYYLFNLDDVGRVATNILAGTILLRTILNLFAQLELGAINRTRILYFGLIAVGFIFTILMLGVSLTPPTNVAIVFGWFELLSGILRLSLGVTFNQARLGMSENGQAKSSFIG